MYEQVSELTEQRRQRIALWVQNNLNPVERLMQNNGELFDITHPNDTAEQDASTSEFEVREYQLDAWAAIWDARQAGHTHGLIHLATGLGKTSVAVLDAIKFREEFLKQHERTPKILFTCHKNEILRQAAERFHAFMPDATTGFYNGSSKVIDRDVVFGTMQSLHANLDLLDPQAFDYIIDDEVHHSKANTYEKVVRHFKPQFRLGLTATPNRSDQKDIRELYGEELFSKGLSEALREGWLAAPDYHIVFDDAVKQAMQSGFEANSLRALSELFSLRPRNDVIANNIKEEMSRIGLELGSVKTIIFCQSIEYAEEMATLLGGKAYHSDEDQLSEAERQRVFDEFKNGGLQVITTRDMFNEGVDVPDARLLVFLRSTSSQTVFEQQLGRGLRKHKGKDTVSVLDFVANIERIAMIKALSDNIRGNSSTEPGPTSDGGEIICGADETEGIKIHTNHGDFEFDKLSVALLDRLKEIQDLINRTDWDRYTDQQIVDLALAFSPDGPLNDDSIDALSRERLFPSRTVILKRWGNLSRFWNECGFEVKVRPSDMSDEEILNLISSTLGAGVVPTVQLLIEASKTTDLPEYSSLVRKFGSINAIKRGLGFEVTDFSTMSAEEIVHLTKSLKEKYGYESITQEFIDELSKKNEFPSRTIINRIFGGMSAFRVACGEGERRIRQSVYDNLTNDDLIDMAKALSPYKPLSANEIDNITKANKFPNRFYIAERFGSLAAFQEACGFNTELLTKENIVDKAKRISPDTPLSSNSIKQLSKNGEFASAASIIKIFGSIKAFHEACGFDTKKPSDLTNDELVDLAKSISPDKRLTKAEFAALSKEGRFISYSSITIRFGSMGEFYKACGW